MNKKIVLIMCLLSFSGLFLYTADITQLMEMYKTNQHKIQTLVVVGTMNIQIIGADGNIINEIASNISMYMKYPDLFKLVISDPVQSITVQKGDTITQKIGSDPALSQKADMHNDLFKKYFAYEIAETFDTSRILGQETITIDGKTHYKFTIEIPESGQNTDPGTSTAEIVFNQNGMIVLQILFSNNTELVKSESSYILKDSIYVTQQLKTTMKSGEMIIINTMTYNAISINKEISDKEFELK